MVRLHAVRCVYLVSCIHAPFLSRIAVVIKIPIFSHYFRHSTAAAPYVQLVSASVCVASEPLESTVKFYNSRVSQVCWKALQTVTLGCTVLQSTAVCPTLEALPTFGAHVVFRVLLAVKFHYCCIQLLLICLYN